MSIDERAAGERSLRGRFSGLYRMLVLDIVLPLVVVQVGLHYGLAPVAALSFAAIFPLVDTVFGIVRSRSASIVAIVSLAAIVTGIVLALVTGNALFAILKDSAFSLLFSLVFLGSLTTPQPLIFRLYHQMLDAQAQVPLDAAWTARPGVRKPFYLMTLVWGLGLLSEALLRVAVTVTTPISTAAAASPWIAFVCIGSLILWTVAYSRARRLAALRAGLALP